VIPDHNLRVISHGEHIYSVSVSIGFAESDVDILELLEQATKHGVPPFDQQLVSVFTWFESIAVEKPAHWYGWFWRAPLVVYQHLKQLFPEHHSNVYIDPDRNMAVGMIAAL